MSQLKNYTSGILLKVLNLGLFTCISLLAMHISHKLPSIQSFFMICCIASLLFIPWILYASFISTKSYNFKTYSLRLCLTRAVFHVAGMFAWLEALKHLGGNDATAISYMVPIFTVILACTFCGEKPTLSIIFAIGLGFVGMYIILRPSITGMASYGAVIGLISAFAFACHDILCKKQTTKEHYVAQSFYQFLCMAILTSPFALYNWFVVDLVDFQYVCLISIVSIINVVVLFLAYKFAPIVVLMPFSYCRLIFMAVGTYILFRHTLSSNSIIGVIIISVSSLYIFYRQYRSGFNNIV